MNGFSLEAASLDSLVLHDNLLQSTYWAALKRRFGSNALAFSVRSQAQPISTALSGRRLDRLPLLVFLRNIPGLSGACIGYVPHGPDIELPAEDRQPFLEWLSAALCSQLPKGCVFLRFDLPFLIDSPNERDRLFGSPLKRAVTDVQVPDTVVVDLTAGEDEILSRMKNKTRYNVRLSARRGVTVRDAGAEELDLWHKIATETAGRDRITLHAKSYFAALFEEAAGRSDTEIKLLVAEAEGKPLAAVILTIFGKRCIYHFGASRTEGRNLMPTFALQWEAMKYAKSAGCTVYDLLGIPPTDDPKHPLHGLYRVKTGFGGTVVHRAGCWDYPIHPAAYRFYRAAESARNMYFKQVRKKAIGAAKKLFGG